RPAPVHLQNEIAKLFLTPQIAVLAVVVDDAIMDCPVLRRCGVGFPAGKVLAVEQRDRAEQPGVVSGKNSRGHDSRARKTNSEKVLHVIPWYLVGLIDNWEMFACKNLAEFDSDERLHRVAALFHEADVRRQVMNGDGS